MTRADQDSSTRKLLPRTERRAQLIQVAAKAFARQGYAATNLEDVSLQAGVTRAIIYRHFASKQELFRAVLDETQARLSSKLGKPDAYGPDTVSNLVQAACEDPDGFRLLFRHVPQQPDFAEYVRELNQLTTRTANTYFLETQPNEARRRWLADLVPKVTIEFILSWLEADSPTEPAELVEIIRTTSQNLIPIR